MDEIFGIGLILLFIVGYFLFSFIALITLLSRTSDMRNKIDLMQRKLLELGRDGIKTETPRPAPKTMDSFQQEFQKPAAPATPPAPTTPPVADPVLRSTPEIPKAVPPVPVPSKEEFAKPITAAST